MIGRYERATSEAGALKIAALAQAYGVSCNWLLGEGNEMKGCTHGRADAHPKQIGERRHVANRFTALPSGAEAIVKLCVERSEHGGMHKPILDAATIRKGTGLSDREIVEAVEELESRGYMRRHKESASSDLGFVELAPEGDLFAEFDRAFTSHDPEADAKVIAKRVVQAGSRAVHVPALAASLEWEPSRMNPALHYLIGRGLVACSKRLGVSPWVTHSLRRTALTRPPA